MLEIVPPIHETTHNHLYTDQFLEKVRRVVAILLEDNRAVCKVLRNGEEGFDNAWHPRTLYLCNRLEDNHVISMIAEHVTHQVSCVLGMHHITPQDLRTSLPPLDRQQHAGGVYVMIASHNDGRYAVYVGSSINLSERIKRHVSDIQIVRNGATSSSVQHCHSILGENGWTVTYHALTVFTQTTSYIWIHMFETVFIILLRSIESGFRGRWHTDACAKLWEKLCSSVGQDSNSLSPVMGLNRCLPTKAGFRGTHQALELSCPQCGTESSCQWHPYLHGKVPFDTYVCDNCFRYGKRRKTEKQRTRKTGKQRLTRTKYQQVHLEQRRVFRQSRPKVGVCDSCKETKNTRRFPKLKMVLCLREISYYNKYGKLKPSHDEASRKARIDLKKKYPVLEKCLSCNEDVSTASQLIRHQATGLVLCHREAEYWSKNGILTPVRAPLDHRCQRPGCGRKGKLRWSANLQEWRCYEGDDLRCVPEDS